MHILLTRLNNNCSLSSAPVITYSTGCLQSLCMIMTTRASLFTQFSKLRCNPEFHHRPIPSKSQSIPHLKLILPFPAYT